jgi:hypothetical protein
MAKSVRTTHRTDTRGTVREDLSGLYEQQSLKRAAKAGIPAKLLDPGGWDGNENDLTGYWAELAYRLGEVRFTSPTAVQEIAAVIAKMHELCRGLGVDPLACVPYDMARFKRQLHEHGEHLAALKAGTADLPLAELEDVLPGWN